MSKGQNLLPKSKLSRGTGGGIYFHDATLKSSEFPTMAYRERDHVSVHLLIAIRLGLHMACVLGPFPLL